MATGFPECDREVYESGRVAMITSLRAKRMEPWVTRVRERSEQRVDWHYFGGRAVVKFLGNPGPVRDAIVAETQSFVDAHAEEAAEYDVASHYRPGAQIAEGWNGMPSIRLPLGERHVVLAVVDIDQETGTEIQGSGFWTTLDDFVGPNSEDADLVARTRALEVNETAEFGGGASVFTRVRRVS